MNEVKIVRLSTGEELLTTVEKTHLGLKLTDCAILIPTEQNSLGLAPFMAYSKAAEDGIVVPESYVMFMVEPVAELKAQYDKMFSKIITPPKQKIII